MTILPRTSTMHRCAPRERFRAQAMGQFPITRDLCIYLDPNFTPLLVYAQFFLSFSLGIVVSMWANLL
jgi:hypothetical protein